MKLKTLFAIVVVMVILSVGIYLGVPLLQKKDSKINDLISTPISTISPTILPTIESTPKPSMDKPVEITTEKKGKISLKLCYPSSTIPKGTIQAKNTQTNKITEKEYKGIEEEKSQNVSFDLIPGSYILRYAVNGPEENMLYGYSTDVCSTGIETSCAAINKRKNNTFTIKENENLKDVSICDYYYNKDTEPKF